MRWQPIASLPYVCPMVFYNQKSAAKISIYFETNKFLPVFFSFLPKKTSKPS